MDKAEILAALKPFSEVADFFDNADYHGLNPPEDTQEIGGITAGMVRRARRVLAALDPANERTDLDTHLVRLFAEQSSPAPASAPEPSDEAVHAAWEVYGTTSTDETRAALRAAYRIDGPSPSAGGGEAKEIVAKVRRRVFFGNTTTREFEISDEKAAAFVQAQLTAARAEGQREGLREGAGALAELADDIAMAHGENVRSHNIREAHDVVLALADQEPKP